MRFACEVVTQFREHKIEIVKVAAHTDIAQSEDMHAQCNVLGNEAADKAAKLARISLDEHAGDLLKQLRKTVYTNEAASTRPF